MRRGLGYGQSGGRRERREAVLWRDLVAGQSGGPAGAWSCAKQWPTGPP